MILILRKTRPEAPRPYKVCSPYTNNDHPTGNPGYCYLGGLLFGRRSHHLGSNLGVLLRLTSSGPRDSRIHPVCLLQIFFLNDNWYNLICKK